MNNKINTNTTKRTKKVQPLVTVIMPVYNAAPYVAQAVQSILNQTYKNIQFVIVDDASTDHSWKVLRSYARQDKRIKLLRNRINRGVSETAKKAFAYAKGDFIARMDADDISLPTRLEKQVAYLQRHKKTVAIGGQCMLIDKEGKVIGEKNFPTRFEDIYKYIFHFIPVQQPTMMIAHKRLPENFVYYKDGMNTAEEVELFFKLFQYGKVENIKDSVLLYRMHDTNTSLLDPRKTFLLTLISRVSAIFKYNYKPTAMGIVMTFSQALLVMLLPRSMTMFLYRTIRKNVISRLHAYLQLRHLIFV